MADDVTLLPCKVCNSKRAVPVRYESGSYGPYWRVSCANCEYDGPARKTKEAAIAAWNACVPNPRIAALEAQLADARDWSSTLADAADDLRAELREAERELAAIKARRCETCRHCKQWTTSDGEPRAACTRLSDAHKVIEFVVPERDGCSRWQDREAADA